MSEGSKMMDVFTVVDKHGEVKAGESKSYWRKLGKAFTNRDGSINVYLDAVPTNGKLQLREPDEKRDEASGIRGWANGGARRDSAAALEG